MNKQECKIQLELARQREKKLCRALVEAERDLIDAVRTVNKLEEYMKEFEEEDEEYCEGCCKTGCGSELNKDLKCFDCQRKFNEDENER